jgi:hypothetical protein
MVPTLEKADVKNADELYKASKRNELSAPENPSILRRILRSPIQELQENEQICVKLQPV